MASVKAPHNVLLPEKIVDLVENKVSKKKKRKPDEECKDKRRSSKKGERRTNASDMSVDFESEVNSDFEYASTPVESDNESDGPNIICTPADYSPDQTPESVSTGRSVNGEFSFHDSEVLTESDFKFSVSCDSKSSHVSSVTDVIQPDSLSYPGSLKSEDTEAASSQYSLSDDIGPVSLADSLVSAQLLHCSEKEIPEVEYFVNLEYQSTQDEDRHKEVAGLLNVSFTDDQATEVSPVHSTKKSGEVKRDQINTISHLDSSSVGHLKDRCEKLFSVKPETVESKDKKQHVETGVSVHKVVSNLYQTCGTEKNSPTRVVTTGISVAELCRSYTDLTKLQRPSSKPSIVIEPLNISVAALRRSYWDLSSSKPKLTSHRELSRSVPNVNESDFTWTSPGDKGVNESQLNNCYGSSFCFSQENIPSVDMNELKSNYIAKSESVVEVRKAKVSRQFNKVTDSEHVDKLCKKCNKEVFVVELIKAEKVVWHKNCFRCEECKKQLTVDTYSSHEGILYCKPHHKKLLQPKVVVNEDEPMVKKPELIIRESQPMELPPDVVRSSDKTDHVLEELSNRTVDIKTKFSYFEKHQQESGLDRSPSQVHVKRSSSILSKMAKFDRDGVVGIPDDLPDESDEEEGSTGEEEGDDTGVIKYSKKGEEIISCREMADIRSKFESKQSADRKEELAEQRKEDMIKLRARLSAGRHNNLKSMYENAVTESEKKVKETVQLDGETKASLLKEKFESGQILSESCVDSRADDIAILKDAGTARGARNLFKEIDSNLPKSSIVRTPSSLSIRFNQEMRKSLIVDDNVDVVKSSDQTDDVQVQTTDISAKFKFFETYKAPEQRKKEFRITPPREGQVKTEEDSNEESEVQRPVSDLELLRSNTTSQMLNKFRQLEQKAGTEEKPSGLKPLKSFTPPPEYTEDTTSESENESDYDSEGSMDDHPTRIQEEIISMQTERAHIIASRFENWEKKDRQKLDRSAEEEMSPSLDTAKNLRAKFEAMRTEAVKNNVDRPRMKVNRFI